LIGLPQVYWQSEQATVQLHAALAEKGIGDGSY